MADDGSIFDKEEECLEYEKNYSWFTKIWNGYKDPNKNNKWVSGLVDKGDVCNSKFVLDNLQKHFDITPKKPNGPLLNNSDNNQQTWQNPLAGEQLLHENTPTTSSVFPSFS